jgi:hypothetical protein
MDLVELRHRGRPREFAEAAFVHPLIIVLEDRARYLDFWKFRPLWSGTRTFGQAGGALPELGVLAGYPDGLVELEPVLGGWSWRPSRSPKRLVVTFTQGLQPGDLLGRLGGPCTSFP